MYCEKCEIEWPHSNVCPDCKGKNKGTLEQERIEKLADKMKSGFPIKVFSSEDIVKCIAITLDEFLKEIDHDMDHYREQMSAATSRDLYALATEYKLQETALQRLKNRLIRERGNGEKI